MTLHFYIQYPGLNQTRLKKFTSPTELDNFLLNPENIESLKQTKIIFVNADTGKETGGLTVQRYMELSQTNK